MNVFGLRVEILNEVNMVAFEDERERCEGDADVLSPTPFQRALEDEMENARHEPVRKREIEVRSLVAQTLSPERQQQIDGFKAELLALPKELRAQRVAEMRKQDPDLINSVQASLRAKSEETAQQLQAVRDSHAQGQQTDAMIIRAMQKVGNDTLNAIEDVRKRRRSA